MSLAVALRHRQGDFTLDVDFAAPEGVTVLYGRSGAGKSSVIGAVAGLVRPEAGRIAVGARTLFDSAAGTDVPVHRRRAGVVFQEPRLFPHLTVRENMLYARRVTGRRGAGALDEVTQLLGIGALLDRRPRTLSGGEASRVAIGRALLSEPEILLMDEPLAALDEARRAEILPYLERLRDHARMPILYVSHNLGEVARLATHLVVLEGGRVVRAGPPETLLADPSLVHLLGLREAGSVIAARVAAHAGDGVTELSISGGPLYLPRIEAEVGTALRVRILAQDVLLATKRPEGLSALNVLPVEVVSLRYGGGPGVTAQLRAGEDLLLARITRRSTDALGLREGMRCFAVLKSLAVAPTDVGGPG
ncbi:molybdenum ABC transporter ATP-binding protein [Roseivivax sediminis]|uniref:Molybdate transport system ATP-binding protein n=1 Tax=Roseivivax sediminis TaxID=936889 RepID=A0A1I2BK65_9RHOB|nr:molybdenum ABC transporter ATP-binding protein [Roseivivax sediminis]SFE56188.1 molybdate transport system ATP-binding protein [Roseivivax sediminis]